MSRPWEPTPGQPLTGRQQEFLQRTADGESWQQIGTAMGLTIGGVGSLSKQVLRKLDARSAAHAVCRGYESGLLGRKPRRPTAQQLSILTLAADGLSNAQIAERLGLPLHAVRNALHETFLLLGVTRRADAIDAARRAGLIPATLRSAA
ncbi:LuxR C-terminal-related transcriptional regulator [Kitasatospora indigofera]|uniref:LuxR C-terminal-related transcriptional regulator n=1 Tax=Kitasatospora indigofera TaxID=67307 RepID=UPI00367E2869